jgi:hypothetical protein
MGEVLKDSEPLLNNRVGLLALDVSDKAYAASVMLMLGVI